MLTVVEPTVDLSAVLIPDARSRAFVSGDGFGVDTFIGSARRCCRRSSEARFQQF